MRHPFEGIIPSTTLSEEQSNHPRAAAVPDGVEPQPARRTILRALAALVAGAAGGLVAAPRDAAAQRMTTQALGEEGGPRHRVFPAPRGGSSPPWHGGYPPGHRGYLPPGHGGTPPGLRRRWGVTTQTLGEEGGPPRRGRWSDRVTTQALGEEGGRRWRGHGLATTEALGEEGAGGGYPRF
jgi:hypothetical protein